MSGSSRGALAVPCSVRSFVRRSLFVGLHLRGCLLAPRFSLKLLSLLVSAFFELGSGCVLALIW